MRLRAVSNVASLLRRRLRRAVADVFELRYLGLREPASPGAILIKEGSGELRLLRANFIKRRKEVIHQLKK
jgi:hypothetical protein